MSEDSLGSFTAIKRKTLGQTVYDVISDALMKGALKPGTRVRTRDLAQTMATSVTPVREAILQLIQEGALEMPSPRNVRVPVLRYQRYMEIRNIRIELEGLAARHAAMNVTEGDLQKLSKLLKNNESAIADCDFKLATELNQRFHFIIVDIANMPLLKSILHGLWMQSGPIISAVYEKGGRKMIDTHYVILDALRDGDEQAAEDAMKEDILSGGDIIVSESILSLDNS